LVRRCAKGAKVTPEAHRSNNGGGKMDYRVVGQANNNGNPKPDSGGRHINRSLGEEIHS